MSESYLTEAEVAAIQSLPRKTPYVIRNVSMTQFSIARHYGAAKYNGADYTYNPQTDELIRDDVLVFVSKLRKPGKAKKPAPTDNQKSLFAGNAGATP